MSEKIYRCLSKDKFSRYSNAKSLAQDIKNFQTGEFVSAYKYPFSVVLKRWAKSHRGLIFAIAAIFIILILPALAFLTISVAFTPPISEDNVTSILNDMHKIANTNQKGGSFYPDFRYGRLINETADIEEVKGLLKLPDIPKKPDPNTDKALSTICEYSIRADSYPVFVDYNEGDLYLSGLFPLFPPIGGVRRVVFSLTNRAKWYEQQGRLDFAVDSYVAALNIAKSLSKDFHLVCHMLSIFCVEICEEPLIDFLANYGHKLPLNDLIKIEEALKGHEPIIEAIEYEVFWRILNFVKMAQLWPRTIDNEIFRFAAIRSSKSKFSLFEKTLFVLMPRNFFRYVVFLQLKKYGTFESLVAAKVSAVSEKNNDKHSYKDLERIVDSRQSLQSKPLEQSLEIKIRLIEEARLLTKKMGTSCLEGHYATFLIYNILFNKLSEIFNLGPLKFTPYVDRSLKRDTALDHIGAMVAIWRYQKQTGSFPKAWDDLIPDFLSYIPHNYSAEKHPVQLKISYLVDGNTTKPYVTYNEMRIDK